MIKQDKRINNLMEYRFAIEEINLKKPSKSAQVWISYLQRDEKR